MAAHRYWRILWTDFFTPGDVAALAEVEMMLTAGGADQTGAGTAIASSTLSTNVPARAFDNTLTNFWASSTNGAGWIGYDFGSGVTKDIRQMTLRARSDSPYQYQAPKNADIQWSDDGAAWTTAWSIGVQSAWAVGEFRSTEDPAYPAGNQVNQVVIQVLSQQPNNTVVQVNQVVVQVLSKVAAAQATGRRRRTYIA